MGAIDSKVRIFEARVKLRSTADGGRREPIRSGFTPNWWVPDPVVEGNRILVSAAVEIVGSGILAPGQEGIVRIRPVTPELWERVESGTPLRMTEGPAFVVAEGIVTGVSRGG